MKLDPQRAEGHGLFLWPTAPHHVACQRHPPLSQVRESRDPKRATCQGPSVAQWQVQAENSDSPAHAGAHPPPHAAQGASGACWVPSKGPPCTCVVRRARDRRARAPVTARAFGINADRRPTRSLSGLCRGLGATYINDLITPPSLLQHGP